MGILLNWHASLCRTRPGSLEGLRFFLNFGDWDGLGIKKGLGYKSRTAFVIQLQSFAASSRVNNNSAKNVLDRLFTWNGGVW